YDTSGSITEKVEYEYSDGYRTKAIRFDENGIKSFETIYDGSAEQKVLSRIYFSEGETITEKEDYNSEGYLSLLTKYYPSGTVKSETTYDGTSEENIVSKINYDEAGNVIN
ncbi:MAG: hypothetical protein IKR01_04245, partial [Spirochaetales bacterium]|nr:hypothetical protein [Spirochaetales bacterium]